MKKMLGKFILIDTRSQILINILLYRLLNYYCSLRFK